MRINVYEKNGYRPIRERKWVKNVLEAQSFCDWYYRTYGRQVNYVITR